MAGGALVVDCVGSIRKAAIFLKLWVAISGMDGASRPMFRWPHRPYESEYCFMETYILRGRLFILKKYRASSSHEDALSYQISHLTPENGKDLSLKLWIQVPSPNSLMLYASSPVVIGDGVVAPSVGISTSNQVSTIRLAATATQVP
jgi:hypothetical protein